MARRGWGVAQLCELLCDCDLVIRNTFKGATAGLVSAPCISMFVFVFPAAIAAPRREGVREGGVRRAGGGGAIPCMLGRFLHRDDGEEKKRDSGRKRRGRRKRKRKNQGDCQS